MRDHWPVCMQYIVEPLIVQTCEVRWHGHRATSAYPSIPEVGTQMMQTSKCLVLWNPSVGKALSILSHRSSSISNHRPVYQVHVSHFSMRKPLHVHYCCHKMVMFDWISVFPSRLQSQPPVHRAVLNDSIHSESATPTQQLTLVPLTKCSLTLQVDFRDHMFLIEMFFRLIFIYYTMHISAAVFQGRQGRPASLTILSEY